MTKIGNLSREDRAHINILSSLGTQIVAVLCAFVVPRLIMSYYGSEQYGAVSSITQFLGFITLLEGGICGVARSALYKTLAEHNHLETSAIIHEVDTFFKKISLIFCGYVLVLAFSFKRLSEVEDLSYLSSVLLVLAISISTIAQYLFGIKYVVFLQAAQRAYIVNAVTVVSTVGNTILTILLVMSGQGLVVVKFISSIFFLLKPFFLSVYVKKNFQLMKMTTKTRVIAQKWEALGQHIAYFIHTNTDILVLTVLSNLKNVAVYSVYNMIMNALQNFIYSFSNGMEPLFGELLAKNEQEELDKKVSYYEILISVIATIVFLTTAVLIVPFVGIYTRGLTDANYYQPIFSLLLVISVTIYCVRLPYHALIIAAGKFKETRIGAYGEAIINLTLSITLVPMLGLIGVALGTICGSLFRFLYYMQYLSKYVLQRRIWSFVKRICYTFIPLIGIYVLEQLIISDYSIENYFEWVLVAVVIFGVNSIIVIGVNFCGYKNEIKNIVANVVSKIKRGKRC